MSSGSHTRGAVAKRPQTHSAAFSSFGGGKSGLAQSASSPTTWGWGIDANTPLGQPCVPPSHASSRRKRSSQTPSFTPSQELRDSPKTKLADLVPVFSPLELMELSTEQILKELAVTEKLLVCNIRRQEGLVQGRLRQTQCQLRNLKVLELPSEARPSRYEPPKWPTLGPTSFLPGLVRKSASTSQISEPSLSRQISADDESQPDDLFRWVDSLSESCQSKAALERVLAPLSKPPPQEEEDAPLESPKISKFGKVLSLSSEDCCEDELGAHSRRHRTLRTKRLEEKQRAGLRANSKHSMTSSVKSTKNYVNLKKTLAKEAETEESAKSAHIRLMRENRLSLSRGRIEREHQLHGDSAEDPFAKTDKPWRTLEIDRDKCMSAWTRLNDGGMLGAEYMVMLLNMAGHSRGNKEWVNEIMADEFGDRSMLDKEDFVRFINVYEARFRSYLEDEFNRADVDHNQRLSAGEISKLLRAAGMTPVPGVVEELMLEITGVDNGMAELSLRQFLVLHDLMQERAGFTISELSHLRSLFLRYDRSGDGRIDAKELNAALSWWGFKQDKALTERLIYEVDHDRSGSVNVNDYLQIMRKHRECEIETLYVAFEESDTDSTGAVGLDDLPVIFEKLGFCAASPTLLADCAQSCGIRPAKDTRFEFEDIFIVLEELRQSEGFLASELKDIKECFDMFDYNSNETIGGLDLGRAIQWLGYPQTVEQLQAHLEDFEIDDSGLVDFQEFLKICRRYREEEVACVRQHFKQAAEGDVSRDIHNDAKRLLLQLGHTPPEQELKRLVKEVCGGRTDAGLWDLDALVRKYRMQARKRYRMNQGFTDRDLERLQKSFDRFDPQRTGAVERGQLAALLLEMFPGADVDIDKHQKVRKMIEQVDEDHDAKLEFNEYLKMMRIVQDEEDLKKIQREASALQATKYSRAEVGEFRKIFQMFDSDHAGEMELDEFVMLISSVTPVRGGKVHELQNMLHEVNDSGQRTLDFPGFLRIMRKIEDENWNNVGQAIELSRNSSCSVSFENGS